MFTSITSLGGIFENVSQLEQKSEGPQSELYLQAVQVCERIIREGLLPQYEDKEVLDYVGSPILNCIYTRLTKLSFKNKKIRPEDISHLWKLFPVIIREGAAAEVVQAPPSLWDDLNQPYFCMSQLKLAEMADNLSEIVEHAVIQYGSKQLFEDFNVHQEYQYVANAYAILDSGVLDRVEMFRSEVVATPFNLVAGFLCCCREFVPEIWDRVLDLNWWNEGLRTGMNHLDRSPVMLEYLGEDDGTAEFSVLVVTNSECVTALLDRYSDRFTFGKVLSLRCSREAIRGLIPRVKDFPCLVELIINELVGNRDIGTLNLIAREWPGTVLINNTYTFVDSGLKKIFAGQEKILRRFRQLDTDYQLIKYTPT